MKKRLQDEEEQKTGSLPPSIRSIRGGRGFSKASFVELGLVHNSSEVDHFLKEHVKNVWELGDEIRIA